MKIIASFTGLLIWGLKYSVLARCFIGRCSPRGSASLAAGATAVAGEEGEEEGTLLVLSIIRREDPGAPFWTLFVPRVARPIRSRLTPSVCAFSLVSRSSLVIYRRSVTGSVLAPNTTLIDRG